MARARPCRRRHLHPNQTTTQTLTMDPEGRAGRAVSCRYPRRGPVFRCRLFFCFCPQCTVWFLQLGHTVSVIFRLLFFFFGLFSKNDGAHTNHGRGPGMQAERGCWRPGLDKAGPANHCLGGLVAISSAPPFFVWPDFLGDLAWVLGCGFWMWFGGQSTNRPDQSTPSSRGSKKERGKIHGMWVKYGLACLIRRRVRSIRSGPVHAGTTCGVSVGSSGLREWTGQTWQSGQLAHRCTMRCPR